MTNSLINSPLQAVSIVTNCWTQSMRFYQNGLGYNLLDKGYLTDNQRLSFGQQLNKYALLGHQTGSVVRLIETTDSEAIPNRLGARPWDLGMAVFEAGTPDIDRAYYKLLRARFGAIAIPVEFDAEGPEPLGYVVMKSTAFIGPAGEQIFVTQIVRRRGGVSLLQESAIDGINTPGNVVISMQNRQAIEQFWQPILGISPVNDLPLIQPEAATIMGGPADMGFDMLLMGYGTERIGLEQHIYASHNPTYDYQLFPCTFEKTGLASATWLCDDLAEAEKQLNIHQVEIISRVGLPIRKRAEPKAMVIRGPLGEIIELIEK
jgi:hypothetical protein